MPQSPVAPQWSAPIAWSAVDRELSRARGAGAFHALILNLAVWSEDPATADATAALVAGLGPRFPVRLLLLCPAPQAERCELRVGSWGGVCASELLRLDLPAAQRAEAHRLLAPLLVGDLPALLWWRAPAPARGLALADLTRRMLVDSLQLELAPAAVQALEAQLAGRASLADLAWSRLTPWRQLLCQGMEAHPEAGFLHDLAAMTVIGGGGDAVGALPALLAGWFTAQLGWRPWAALNPRELWLERGLERAGAPPVRLRFEPGAAPLQGVRLLARDGAPVFALAAERGRLRMELQCDGALVGQSVSAAAGLELRGAAEALAEELGMTQPDRLYRRALAAACGLLAQLTLPEAA